MLNLTYTCGDDILLAKDKKRLFLKMSENNLLIC